MALNPKNIALNIAVTVTILLLPYVVAMLFDMLMSLAGYETNLSTAVAPLYVLTIQLLFLGISYGFILIDWLLNGLISLINLAGVNITWRSNLSQWIQSLGNQVTDIIVQFTFLVSSTATIALKKR